MTEKTTELLKAALMLLPFLKASTDDCKDIKKAESMPPKAAAAYLMELGPWYDETPAQRLRREADEIEAKDAAIKRFRAAVAAFEEG